MWKWLFLLSLLWPSMATPTLRQWTLSNDEGKTDSVVNIWLPNPTAAGCCLILALQAGTGVSSATAVDDASNTYATAVNFLSGQRVIVLVATNIAAGAKHITLTLNVAAANVGVAVYEFFNVSTAAVASALDGTATGTSAASPVATGAITTVSDGDLIFQWGVQTSIVNPFIPSFTKGTGFTKAGSQLSDGTFVQYQVQGTHGAITPTFTYGGTSRNFDTVAIALKSGTSGSALDTSTGPKVFGVQHQHWFTSTLTMAYEFPCQGNLLVIASTIADFGISTVTDGNSNTWTKAVESPEAGGGSGLTDIFYTSVVPTVSTDMTGPTVTLTSATTAAGQGEVHLYDIIGAATSSVLGATAQTTGTQTVAGNLSSVSLTPQQAKSLVLCATGIVSHTISNVVGTTNWNTDLYVEPLMDGVNSLMDEDNGFAHYYAPDTSPLTFVWATQNNTAGVQGWSSSAAEFKAPAASAAWANLGSAWHPGQSPGLGGISSARFQTNWWPYGPPVVVSFDPALMSAMEKHGNDPLVLPPQVVASGMTPPEEMPT
jgi:hypothetical protein